MNLNNKQISGRQSFRMGVLENISLGMVIIPYITVNLAGRWHFVALLIGLILAGLYMFAIYMLSGKISCDKPGYNNGFVNYGRTASYLYTIRFILRAGLIMLFFGRTVQEFLLQSFNLWIIVIVFAVVCGYGASQDIEKRGRMLELLFPWMVVPIVLVAVFSISSINIEELYRELMGVNYDMLRDKTSVLDVLTAGYVSFLVISTGELMLFTLPYEKERNWRNTLKTGIWILISILLAYIFVIGILGGHWVASDSQASLNVMEAAFIPGEIVERSDYPVLAFWIIGVFAIISGYMHFAKEAFLVGAKLKDKKRVRWGLWFVMLAVVGFSYLWSVKPVKTYLAMYILWADVLISLLIPITIIILKGKGRLRQKEKMKGKGIILLVMIMGSTTLISGCSIKTSAEEKEPMIRQQESIENRDYVTEIIFQGEYMVIKVADIKKYLSDATGDFETKEEKFKVDSIINIMDNYYEDKGRQLDLGHLSGITFEDMEEDSLRDYVIEMSNITQMGKSVTVSIITEEKIYKIPLRQLIKKAYAGENFT